MSTGTYQIGGQSTIPTNDLFISTLQKRAKYVIDQIFNQRPILAWLLARKDTKLLNGSQQFELPVGTRVNPNGGMISINAGLPLDDYDPLDLLIYERVWAGFNVRKGTDVAAVNRGPGEIIKLVDYKIENTITTMKQTLNMQLWSGSGSGVNANGITLLIPATARASQNVSVGGRNPSGNPWWRTQYINMASQAASTWLERKMSEMNNTIIIEEGKVDVIFTDKLSTEIYEHNQQDFLTTDNTKIGDANFEMVQFKKKPIIFDDLAPAGQMRMVDNDAIKFCCDPNYWFKWTGWKELPDVPFLEVQQIVTAFQFARTSGRTIGCIDNISDAA